MSGGWSTTHWHVSYHHTEVGPTIHSTMILSSHGHCSPLTVPFNSATDVLRTLNEWPTTLRNVIISFTPLPTTLHTISCDILVQLWNWCKTWVVHNTLTNVWGVVEAVMTALLQIYCWVCRWKNSRNRSTRDAVVTQNLWLSIFWDDAVSKSIAHRPRFSDKYNILNNTLFWKMKSSRHPLGTNSSTTP